MANRPTRTEWQTALAPLFKKYGALKHPLNYNNRYQLLTMVILSSRSTDVLINKLGPPLFKAFPSMKGLSKAKPEDLFPFIHGITNFNRKAQWLVSIAKMVGDDAHIPTSMEGLTGLPGIGRKSANVIIGESIRLDPKGGRTPEGVMVDLHVARVAPRLGIDANPLRDRFHIR